MKLIADLGVLGAAALCISSAAGGVVPPTKTTMPEAKTGASTAAQAEFPLALKRAKSPGEAIFLARCQYCHLEMGPGTITLAKRLGPGRALLAARTDLSAEFVKTIVRHGLNTMPPINRVEVSDAELDQIAAYLSRPRPAPGSPRK